ncbi:TetR/AcrR family transcriptional regulator [Roseicitreum antarcticum]|uniref:Transcriptional regulator, TetR family n=1 Tax=Roseicitreum antarcticum TaxID=564137 RepID=A0A1H2TKP2_9RHOB|nr:TetR/AcrR family transcriptional regulator [Roseicitreum antarcticum]SDW44255.1 transcriptional regulator, TetR family [Roseicitreum antarcticum]
MSEAQSDELPAKGWRGSREGWLDAAKAAFLQHGLDAVKIQPLAGELKLSRTSFYWFFKDREALLDALLVDWEAKNTGAFVDACTAYAETIAEGVLNLIVVFHDPDLFDPRLDFAVRGWAHQSASVMQRVNLVDERRLATIRAMFQRFGFPSNEADVKARAVYLTQIGYISMQVQESTTIRMARIPAYVETFCGIDPTPSEMARFHARLRFDPMIQSGDSKTANE